MRTTCSSVRAELARSRDRALESVLRLRVGVAWMQRAAVRPGRRRAADGDRRPGAHGAAVARDGLEGAPVPVPLDHAVTLVRAPVPELGSPDRGPRDGGWLAAGEEPAGGGGDQRHAEDDEGEREHRDPAEIAEVVVVGRGERDVGAGDAEQRAEEGERAGGGGGQRTPGPPGGSGRRQRAEVACALAADQPDGQREDREREESTCAGCDRDGRREGGVLPLDLDREPRLGGELSGGRDLFARQWPARLDEPAGRDLLPAVAAKTVECDERGRQEAGVRFSGAEDLAGCRSAGRS